MPKFFKGGALEDMVRDLEAHRKALEASRKEKADSLAAVQKELEAVVIAIQRLTLFD